MTDDALRHATKCLTERLDTDLRGAYRAGYAYLYVGHPLPHASLYDPTGPNVHAVTLPSHHELTPRTLPEAYRWTCYDLDIPPEDWRALVEATRDP